MLPAKRPRAAIIIDLTVSSVPNHDLGEAITGLNGAVLRKLVAEIAAVDPGIATEVRVLYDERIKARQQKILDFDYYSKRIWHRMSMMRMSMMRMSMMRMRNISCQNSINLVLKSVMRFSKLSKQCAGSKTSFGIKKSSLETLRKIGKTIALTGDEVIQERFRCSSPLEEAMLNILDGMNSSEIETMKKRIDRGLTFTEQLEELVEVADRIYSFA